MNVLFICNQNQNRSRTAAELFKSRWNTLSVGLYTKTPVTKEQLVWADIVLVMEDTQRSTLAERFPEEYLRKRILSLDIPDVYHYNQPELIEQLQRSMKSFSPFLK